MPRRRNRSPVSDDTTQPSSDRTQSDKEVRKSAKKGKEKETFEDAFVRMSSQMKNVRVGTYRLRALPQRKEKERRRTHSEPSPRHHPRSATPNRSPHRDASEDEYVNLSPVKDTGRKRRSKKRKSMSVDTQGITPKDASHWRSVGPTSRGELSAEPDSDTSVAERKKAKTKPKKQPAKMKDDQGRKKQPAKMKDDKGRKKTVTPKDEKKADKKPKNNG